ncbi:MAG: HNH endonuclease [Anaerolineales bacterium]
MGAVIPTHLRAQVRALDQERCAYCQSPEELTVTPFEVDHVVPVSAGGETTLDNLCLACPACNRHKATRQSAPDPETGQDAPLYHPRRDTWPAHFEWNADTGEFIGRTPTGRATLAALHLNRSTLVRLRRLWAKMGLFPPH